MHTAAEQPAPLQWSRSPEAEEPSDDGAPVRKRRRTAHACDPCRLRKVRCNGQTPCATCASSNQECTYIVEAAPKGKSEMILSAIARMEKKLEDLGSALASRPNPATPAISASDTFVQPVATPRSGVDNASLSAEHNSTTESILDWPILSGIYSLRCERGTSVFKLEYDRPAVSERPLALFPYAGMEEVQRRINYFQTSINAWYPIVSLDTLSKVQEIVFSGSLDRGVQTCLAALVMALGCAGEAISALYDMDSRYSGSREHHRQSAAMGDVYFAAARRELHLVHAEMSATASQCLMLTAFYYAFMQRPLQAWSYIHATATKCRLLLAYGEINSPEHDTECLRRIFWSCYILESDYLAELSALPQTGVGLVESSIPLPGHYSTHSDQASEESASLYFLACISMRRLLNRVHDLLYAKATGASIDTARFPYLVRELDIQLDDWRAHLPPAFHFTVDSAPAENQAAAFLRQRFLTCRSVIYRPYLDWVMKYPSNHLSIDEATSENCKNCLDACILHIQNLHSFSHTVMVDTWICALSMAGAMLILLAAHQLPSLAPLMGREVYGLGHHLHRLLSLWIEIPSQSPSPSVGLSLRLIDIADGSIRQAADLIGEDLVVGMHESIHSERY